MILLILSFFSFTCVSVTDTGEQKKKNKNNNKTDVYQITDSSVIEKFPSMHHISYNAFNFSI